MRSARCCFLIALVAGFASAPRAQCDDRSEKERSIAALIDQLGDDRFDLRESATRELLKHGDAAIPLLEAAAGHKDAEIRARVRLILDQLISQHVLQCAATDEFLNFRLPPDDMDETASDVFVHAHRKAGWKVTETEKGHLIQVASGPCRGWYFECDDKAEPYRYRSFKIVGGLRLNRELTERAYWKLTVQEEADVYFVQPTVGKFRNWYLDIDLPKQRLLLAEKVVPGAYWRIMEVGDDDGDR